MKGFIVILAAMAVFVAAFITMSASAPQAQGASFNESFSEAKLMITDIELSTLLAAQDCNWQRSIADINQCVDTNATLIIQKAVGAYTTCKKISTTVTTTPTQTYSFDLNCTTLIEDTKGTIFKQEFTKKIVGKKY